MKTSHKSLLKSLLLTSWAAIGTPTANGAIPMTMPFIKKESSSSEGEENPSKTLNEGLLYSSPTEAQAEAHGSHSSHGSHGSHSSHSSSAHASHASHASSYPDGGYGDGSSNRGGVDANKPLTIIAGTVLGALTVTGITMLITKMHKKHKKAKVNTQRMYSATSLRQFQNYNDYFSKTLENNSFVKFTANHPSVANVRTFLNAKYNSQSGVQGDIDELVSLFTIEKMLQKSKQPYDLLMNLGYLGESSRPPILNFKGWKQHGQSSLFFLKQQQNEWGRISNEVKSSLMADSLDISTNDYALTGVSVLLTENGFLSQQSLESQDESGQRESIINAYKDFLKSEHMEDSTIIDDEVANLLISKNKKNEELSDDNR